LLLDAGADARAATHCGDTPLHFAAREGHVAVCRALLAHGVDARAVTRAGAAPLDEARRGGSECEAVVALLEAATGEQGRTHPHPNVH
jgi:ankyrin repeat protein